MRADRLLSILMLLQARGSMTAGELAAELEVSDRTIYRDIDALSTAGVPVYGEAGPKGGYALLDEYRTQLTGLTDNELRALFMLSIPAPLEGLGVDEDLRTAMRKLSASMSDARRGEEERVRSRFLLDARWWNQQADNVPHLRMLHRAVWHDRQLRISYRTLYAGELELVVEPYALVAKAGIWFLVYFRSDRWRAVRVSDLTNVMALDEVFEREPRFNLREFWDDWCERRESESVRYIVKVLVAPEAIGEVRWRFGVDLSAESEGSAELSGRSGWAETELAFESLHLARGQLLALGRGVEVVAPEALRLSIADYAVQVAELYSGT